MSQYVCLRCTRQLVRQQSSRVRCISSSTANSADHSSVSEPLPGKEDEAPSQPRKQSSFGAMVDRAQANPEAGRSPITKYTVYTNGSAPPARLPDGQARRRPSSQVANAPRGGFIARGRGGMPGGQLLRRRAPSPSADSSQPQSDGRAQRGGAAQRGRGRRSPQGRPQRRRDDGESDMMDPSTEAEIEEKISGGSLVSKDASPYNPQPMTLHVFEADWPNTPLSVSGLVGSVQQKAEVLAKRLPHGYVSPDQLAERFHKGDLLKFQDAEEKEKVLAKAVELAKARSDMLTDRRGDNVPASDMSFSSIGKEEGQELASKMGRGMYSELEKQRHPFLDTVMRNLRNNETYHNSKQEEFMAKIASLLPQQGAVKGPQRQKST